MVNIVNFILLSLPNLIICHHSCAQIHWCRSAQSKLNSMNHSTQSIPYERTFVMSPNPLLLYVHAHHVSAANMKFEVVHKVHVKLHRYYCHYSILRIKYRSDASNDLNDLLASFSIAFFLHDLQQIYKIIFCNTESSICMHVYMYTCMKSFCSP